MKISYVIPSYKTDKVMLDRCITSIIAQHPVNVPYEIILVFDGEVTEGWDSNKYPVIKEYVKPNEGVFLTRIYGWMRATGDVIINVDADDLLLDGCAEEVIQAVSNEYEFGYIDVLNMGMGFPVRSRRSITESKDILREIFEPIHYDYSRYFFTSNLVSYLYELFHNVKDYWGYLDDLVFSAALLNKVRTVYHTTNPYYVYTMNPYSMCNNYSEASNMKRFESLMKVKEILLDTKLVPTEYINKLILNNYWIVKYAGKDIVDCLIPGIIWSKN